MLSDLKCTYFIVDDESLNVEIDCICAAKDCSVSSCSYLCKEPWTRTRDAYNI